MVGWRRGQGIGSAPLMVRAVATPGLQSLVPFIALEAGQSGFPMLTDHVIQETAKRIVAAASRPVRVVLFGSYGRGDANEASDIDLLVIEPEISDPSGEYLRLRQAIGAIGVGVDLLLYSQGDFDQRRDWWTSPAYWAAREGKVLHDPEH